MKKLLYSSAVLIASCGVAAADVSVGGDASVGIKYSEGDDLSIAHNVDLNLALSGQTDAGLSFGASVTITNSQGVEVEVKSKSSPVGTVTAMDSDTNTHTGMFYSPNGRTYLDSDDGMPVYTESAGADGVSILTTYHTLVPGSNFTLAPNATTAVTVGTGDAAVVVMDLAASGVGAADSGILSIYDEDDDQVAWTALSASAGDTGGTIHKWGDRYIIQTGASAFSVFEMSDGEWQEVGSVSAVSADELNAFTATTPDNPENTLHIPLLTQIHRAVSAMEAGMAQEQETEPNPDVTFTDTTSVADSKAEGSIEEKATVYISGGFGTFTVGDVDAGDTMASGIADIGYDGIGVDDVAEKLRGKSDRDFLYEFSAGGVSFGVSAAAGGDSSAMGIKYSLDPVSVGLGYARKGGENVVSVGVGAGLAGVSANIMYSRRSDGDTAAGMDASFSAADNMTVTVAGSSNNVDGEKASAFGLGLTFDLGGGATLGTGVGSVDDVTKADLGLNLVF
ncbi:MAG: porin [Albidovulum sp.]|nr:porin [Albidovulum sp.]